MNKGNELRKIYEDSYSKIKQDKRNMKEFIGIYDHYLKKRFRRQKSKTDGKTYYGKRKRAH